MTARLMDFLRERGVTGADWAVLLGSGLAPLEEPLSPDLVATYDEMPDWFVPTVHGHAGRLLTAEVGGRRILLFEGRNHYYEGNSLRPMHLFADLVHALAIPRAMITCAVGGVASRLAPGDIFLIEDSINLLFGPPHGLTGTRRGGYYNPLLCNRFQSCARELGLSVERGTLSSVQGPCYETPAEVRFLATIGTDVVSMSTVHESALLAERGIEVLGVACVSNVHHPGVEEVNHHGVVGAVAEAARGVGRIFRKMR